MLRRADLLELDALTRERDAVVTLVVSVDPRDPRNARAGWRLRAKESLGRTDAPAAAVRWALDALDETATTGRTVVLVGDERATRLRLPLQIELPEHAHYGPPYLTPLLDALADHERYAVLCADERTVRLFCVFAGEIEELTARLPEFDPVAWEAVDDELDQLERPARHAEETDRIDATLAGRRHRALRALGMVLGAALDELRCDRVVLGGPGERAHELETALPERVRRRVAGTIGARLDESPVELLPRVEAVELVATHARELELVERAAERGIVGADATLSALNDGRVYQLVAVAGTGRSLARCGTCGLLTSEPGPCAACGDDLVALDLDEVLPSLAEQHDARLAFVHGEARDRLAELGGLAGLVRF